MPLVCRRICVLPCPCSACRGAWAMLTTGETCVICGVESRVRCVWTYVLVYLRRVRGVHMCMLRGWEARWEVAGVRWHDGDLRGGAGTPSPRHAQAGLPASVAAETELRGILGSGATPAAGAAGKRRRRRRWKWRRGGASSSSRPRLGTVGAAGCLHCPT